MSWESEVLGGLYARAFVFAIISDSLTWRWMLEG